MATPRSARGGHPKQFGRIERLIRATEPPLGPTQGEKKEAEFEGGGGG